MSDLQKTNIPSEVSSGDALKSFQLTTEGVKDKSSKAYGLSISKYIAQTTSFNTAGYYFTRNARFIKNRNYANGRINIQTMFQDRFQFNGKENYIALNWQALQIVNRIVSGLVGRWMSYNEKVQVKAIDDLSQTEKQDEYDQIQFVMENREKLEQLQQESGVQIIPQDQFIPADKEELNLWQAQFQRVPEEILYELGCNDILTSNSWFDVLKEKALHDLAETGFIGTYTWMDDKGVVHCERVKPENSIYSDSEYPDFRDASWLGHAPALKISEIRRKWGKEFNPNNPNALTEQEIWEQIVPKAKEFQYQSNIAWNDIYFTAFLRPYDEWNVRSIQFELRSVENDPYTVTKTKGNGRTYTQKGFPATQSGKRREKPAENQNILNDSNVNIYRGVYLPDCEILLQWGVKDNMIRPQDPKEIGNAEFSYSYYMPQNYLMRNLAIPEKIEAAVDGMILACLKIQQDVSLSIPPGWVIDETAWQGVDYGLGDAGNKAVDQAKLFFQTGKVHYRGLDAEGNRVPVPIQEIANTGFQQHIEAFVRTYQFWYQSLKDELGEDPNLISAALQPRVTGQNVEASQTQSQYATDYFYRGYAECMKMTARKVSCLLNDSVTYGSAAYRNLLKKEDIGKRVFSTDIRLLPSQVDMQRFEAMMNQAIAASPELIQFIDPFQMMRVAAEDVKLAETLFRQGQKKMLLWQQQMAQQNQQQTIDGQIQSATVSEKEKRKSMIQEVTMKGQIEAMVSQEKQKEALITGFMGALQKGVAIPIEWKGVETEIIKNVAIPLFAQNVQNMQQIADGMIQQEDQPDQEEQGEQENQQMSQEQAA